MTRAYLKPRPAASPGQILAGVIVILLILVTIIPTLVMYMRDEARWSVKQQQNTTAFQLAEAAIDRGFRKISESTATWVNGQSGTFPAGYRFDTAYTDLAGGTYAISLTSGPKSEEVTIIGVGRDNQKREVRSIRAIYANAPLGETAVRSQSGVTVGGANTQVHWGAIITPQSVTVAGRTFPQIWSAGSIDLDTNGSTPPNCDQPNCWQWHSFQNNIPPNPSVDLGFYAASATATGTYYDGNQSWPPTCGTAGACSTGNTYYVNGDLTVSPGIFVRGSLIVTGNLSLPNGNCAVTPNTRTIPLPTKAWMQYGNNWAAYQPFDTGEPANFPGLTSNYESDPAITVSLDKVMVEGFLYVGGNLTQAGGGGQCKIAGGVYCVGSVTVTPNNFFIYYTESAGKSMKTTNIILSRQSWRDLAEQGWPIP